MLRIDWEVHFVDSTIVRAHQQAAGEKRGTEQDNNRSVSSRCSKRHWDAQRRLQHLHIRRRHGQTDAVCLDGGTTQRSQRIRHPNTALKVKRTGRKTEATSRYLWVIKAMTHRRFAVQMRRQHTTPVIPKRKNAKCKPRFNRGLYRERNRTADQSAQAVPSSSYRYEKRAENYLAMLMIAAILIWLK